MSKALLQLQNNREMISTPPWNVPEKPIGGYKMKALRDLKILYTEEIATGIYALVLERHETFGDLKPGQFFNLALKTREMPLLKRPISLATWDHTSMTFIIRKVGRGTALLCTASSGELVSAVGPLGNGFDLNEPPERATLVGGGIGTAPLLALAQSLAAAGTHISIHLGFQNEPYLIQAFENASDVLSISTLDPVPGFNHGNVVEQWLKAEPTDSSRHVYSCGPDAMLHSVQKALGARGQKGHLLTEERMACGIGACLTCAKPIKSAENHHDIHMLRTCIEGPVFKAEEVVFDANA